MKENMNVMVGLFVEKAFENLILVLNRFVITRFNWYDEEYI